MNISFWVLSPPVIRHASQKPSFAFKLESQVRSSPTPLHAAPTLPDTQAIGLHRPIVPWALVGTSEARVTRSTSGVPSSFTPLLYKEQKWSVRCAGSAESKASGGSYVMLAGSL